MHSALEVVFQSFSFLRLLLQSCSRSLIEVIGACEVALLAGIWIPYTRHVSF